MIFTVSNLDGEDNIKVELDGNVVILTNKRFEVKEIPLNEFSDAIFNVIYDFFHR